MHSRPEDTEEGATVALVGRAAFNFEGDAAQDLSETLQSGITGIDGGCNCLIGLLVEALTRGQNPFIL